MEHLNEQLRQVSFIVCDVDGVLTDGHMWFDGEGKPFRALHARDGTALALWHLAGHKSALVSGLGSKAVEAIAKQWKCAECYQFIKNKGRVCREISDKYGIPLTSMAFVGDDIIDLTAMRTVGVSVAVSDALPDVKKTATLTLAAPGGSGALRELVHLILAAQGRLEETVQKYCSREDHPV